MEPSGSEAAINILWLDVPLSIFNKLPTKKKEYCRPLTKISVRTQLLLNISVDQTSSHIISCIIVLLFFYFLRSFSRPNNVWIVCETTSQSSFGMRLDETTPNYLFGFSQNIYNAHWIHVNTGAEQSRINLQTISCNMTVASALVSYWTASSGSLMKSAGFIVLPCDWYKWQHGDIPDPIWFYQTAISPDGVFLGEGHSKRLNTAID